MATTTILDATSVTARDYESGIAFENVRRTMTEADAVRFAGLTGDYNPQHVNRDWTEKSVMYGERIAHGLLLSSVGVGMIPQRLKRALGPMRSAHAVYKKPVVLGDTIRISGRALLGREPDGGGPPPPARRAQGGHGGAQPAPGRRHEEHRGRVRGAPPRRRRHGPGVLRVLDAQPAG